MVEDKKYGVSEAFCPSEENESCRESKCGRPIKFMQKCFIDHNNGELYCNSCGLVVRYERKKAQERINRGLPEIKINGE